MDQRRKIGLVFSYNPVWIAGTYYVQNLVHALGTLPDAEQPALVVLCEKTSDFDYLKQQTGYPCLEQRLIRPVSAFRRAINRVARKTIGRALCFSRIYLGDVEYIFPLMGFYSSLRPSLKTIYWIPDFQEDHLPEFFTPHEIAERKQMQRAVSELPNKLVLSSQDAKADFDRLYPSAHCASYVMPFAVTLPDYSGVDTEYLLRQYGIDGEYFFCANQFWAHKNHLAVLEALVEVKSRGTEVLMLFSGKTSDYRNAEHFERLQRYVAEHGLERNVRFLGFLDREVQLALMKNAVAVVQPSLFEGWSTVVEDCKALGQFIVLSDLRVHREQIAQNVEFFDPRTPSALAHMLERYARQHPATTPIHYALHVAAFGRRFIEITQQ